MDMFFFLENVVYIHSIILSVNKIEILINFTCLKNTEQHIIFPVNKQPLMRDLSESKYKKCTFLNLILYKCDRMKFFCKIIPLSHLKWPYWQSRFSRGLITKKFVDTFMISPSDSLHLGCSTNNIQGNLHDISLHSLAQLFLEYKVE